MSVICIGISFYNAEKYVNDAILSVMNQTYSDWSLLLVDDGSTDSSLKIINKYTVDPRVRVISDGQNRGLVYRLNQLINLSNAKYFVRMDADDIMHPKRLEKQLIFLKSNPQIDVVGSWAYSIDTKNRLQGVLKNKIKPVSLEDVFNHAFIHPSIMGKKKWFEKNPYDSQFVRMEDMELWSRTVEYSNFYNLPEPLLYYREVGVPYLSKYLLSMSGERKLVRRVYGRKMLSKYKLLIRNYIKSFVYIVFSIFRLQNILIKKRSGKIDSTLLRQASEDLLKAIKA